MNFKLEFSFAILILFLYPEYKYSGFWIHALYNENTKTTAEKIVIISFFEFILIVSIAQHATIAITGNMPIMYLMSE